MPGEKCCYRFLVTNIHLHYLSLSFDLQITFYSYESLDKTESEQRDVVFLLDGSDETLNGFEAMRDFVQRVVEKLTVEENKDRVSVVQYSREPEAHFYLNTYTTKEDVLDTVRGLRHKGGRPLNTGAALQYVRDNVFIDSSGSRRQEGIPQILILLSGGRSNDDVRNAVTNLKEIGVMAIVVGMRNADTLELQTISHEPSYAFSATHYNDLPNIQQQVVSAVERIEMTNTNLPTTLIGKTAIISYAVVGQFMPTAPTIGMCSLCSGKGSYLCYCMSFEETIDVCLSNDLASVPSLKSGFPFSLQPFFTFISESDKKDVVFLIDGSDDSRTGFAGIRSFAEKVVESLNVEENGDRVALVQYSRDATPNFYLNSYSSKNDVLNSIRSMRHKVGRLLNTGTALQFVRDTVFTASAGGRRAEGVPQYLFVFSGGRSSNDLRGPAQSLRRDGVRTFSFGTRNADTLELQNNSTLLTSDIQMVDGVDVVFLLDGSDKMRGSVQSIRDFLGQFVEHLEIGPDKTHVAVIQYSDKPTTNFLLNTYSSKSDIMAKVRNINLEGGRPLNTGEALDFVKKNVFTASSGSRLQEGIPQILILLSGEKSQDDVLVPSESLKAAGIMLLTVGVKDADGAEMRNIAYSPNQAHLLREFSDLSLVRQQLLSAIVSHKDAARPGLGEPQCEKRHCFPP
uniref:VWFA domain-containing protein n=1 Tax=Hucho hucho TaxID=62062 RepID=A0A4W5NLL5_9TELE